MSEADKHKLSVLLPEARVAVYSTDQTTLESAKALKDDWRFARVFITVEEGDIETATAVYADQTSPDLLIVQTDHIDDVLTDQLEALANHCHEDTAAIVVGPENDVYLYRKLVEMGVSDYLVRPIPADVMADVVGKSLIERLGISESCVIAFAGAKGGVGASTLAQSFAVGVADLCKQRTVLLDASGGWSTLGVHFDCEPVATLSEAAQAARGDDEENFDRMVIALNSHMHVLAVGADSLLESSITSEDADALLDKLMAKYPVVIVDLSHATPELSKEVLIRANQIMLVTSPVLSALRLSRALAQEIKTMKGGSTEDIDLIVNMQGMDKANEVPVKDIEAAMEMKVSAKVPYSNDVFLKSETDGQTILQTKEGERLVREILLPLAQKSLHVGASAGADADKEQTGMLGGFLKKLK